jgi:hypothetical protein
MKVRQATLAANAGRTEIGAAIEPLRALSPNWVLVFGGVEFFANPDSVAALSEGFPDAVILGCSTAGEICNEGVVDHRCVVTAVRLEASRLRAAHTHLETMADSRAAGVRIGEQLKGDGLRAAMVLAPGVRINGTALVEGISSGIGGNLPITGGLAGDGGAFQKTWTICSRGATDRDIVAVGFVGDALDFAHGSFGGWHAFGPARQVTRCDGNVLYELDGEPALTVYKRYLGTYADGLPASGLLFPFEMLGEDPSAAGRIRTILGIDESLGSLTLAGEIEPDGFLKLMHASTDRLVDGAEAAAHGARRMFHCTGDSLAILVSCVGRKLVMGDRVDEEVEAVGEVFGSEATLAGFYSYGEISPFAPGAACQLHNQTMTITWLGERE